ncbi:MAG: HD-GYP domain-containing protein [Phycisphaerales bacterium]|jgi:HD-GYP domain-containing protein (c-di-GMP phosphodiesterase class II)
MDESTHTHDGARARDEHWKSLLTRAQELGCAACVLGPGGRVVAALGTLDESLEHLFNSHVIRERLAGAARVATGAAAEELAPGVHLIVVPLDLLDAGDHLLTALVCQKVPGGPAWAGVCKAAQIDLLLASEAMAKFSGFDAKGSKLVGVALFSAVRDLAAIIERDASLESFTTQLSECYDTIDLVYAVGRRAHAPLDVPGFLRFVIERLLAASNFGWVGLALDAAPTVTTPLRGRHVVAGTLGEEVVPAIQSLLSVGAEADPGRVAAAPVVLPFAAGLSAFVGEQVLLQHIVCKSRSIGVLAAGAKHGVDRVINSYDIQILEALAGYISGFCESVWLYEDQREMFLGTVGAITAALDAKDRYTFGHSERVAHLSQRLAVALGMSVQAAERVHIAGLVHDVGKIGVPEAVLTKPGRLNDEEFAQIKKHPEIGHRILRDIPLLRDILPGVLHHHERVDGRGYPAGLAGEGIPLMARIISVADTFDAMSSNRSYRSAMTREKVLAEIARSAGTQLDPQIAALIAQMDLSGFDALFAKHAALENTFTQKAA